MDSIFFTVIIKCSIVLKSFILEATAHIEAALNENQFVFQWKESFQKKILGKHGTNITFVLSEKMYFFMSKHSKNLNLL